MAPGSGKAPHCYCSELLALLSQGSEAGWGMGGGGDSAGSSTWFLPISVPQVVSALRNALKVICFSDVDCVVTQNTQGRLCVERAARRLSSQTRAQAQH